MGHASLTEFGAQLIAGDCVYVAVDGTLFEAMVLMKEEIGETFAAVCGGTAVSATKGAIVTSVSFEEGAVWAGKGAFVMKQN